MLFLLFSAVAAPLPVLETLETPYADEADDLKVTTTLHVLLQVHAANRGREGMKPTDSSKRCAEQVEETARALLEAGVTHAVVEGLKRRGTYAKPEPSPYRGKGDGVAGRLSRLDGLTIFGMESDEAQPRTGETWQVMLDSAKELTELRHDKETWSTAEERLGRLHEIQTDLYPANTEFVASNLPLRSFHAIQAAFSAANQTEGRDVMVVIGARHWPDFAYVMQTADRVGNDRHVALRIHRYSCEKDRDDD